MDTPLRGITPRGTTGEDMGGKRYAQSGKYLKAQFII